MNIFIYPSNSLILYDLVERFGHKPLAVMQEIRKKVTTAGIDSPPLNITPEDPKHGLKYAAVEVPAGVRGRMSLFDQLIGDAEAAILVEDAPIGFGCMGCQRTSELIGFLIRAKRVPILELNYPTSDDEARNFVYQISEFLNKLQGGET
ncbi:methanogenesis marker 5 protein [ANME-2 cluster archaeon]|nr:methanogenesis marker 5 protein [Methanosarcinales archaeon]RJS74039.1 MAG: methanogenesis marker 5 protein [ANME-2 cluster archaeon]RLG25399.1 MAG: methanogenesis marker 5 protein [Methanosarcinales archaeon]